MADEFAKGLAILTAGGLGWMTLSGWYTTPGFEETQLIGGLAIENPDFLSQVALVTREAMFWFAILGALTFWVLIPAVKQMRGTTVEENE